MIHELFKQLNAKELVVCSMVNKRWHSIYSAFKLKRLVVVSKHKCETRRWYNLPCIPGQIIEDKELCRQNVFFGLANMPLLLNLKYLVLCLRFFGRVEEISNQFKQLEHLEINVVFLGMGSLKLPKLKVLAIYCYNNFSSLSVDCPILSSLLYFGEPVEKDLLNLKHPETIKMLETHMLGPKLTRFSQVECLVITEFQMLSKATILSLPKLRELHCKASIGGLFWQFYNEIGTLTRVKQTLREFTDDVKLYRASGFKFKFAGLSVTTANVDKIDFGMQVIQRNGREFEEVSDTYIYMKNYQLIDPDTTLDFISCIDYVNLMSHMTAEVPSCFFKKFTDIENVDAIGVIQDENHFLNFLKSLSLLRYLHLNGTQLSQQFFDRLPDCANSLTQIV